MSDIMELIEKLTIDAIRIVDSKDPISKIYTLKPLCDKIESRISAMQEVCDAAVEHCNLPKCNCPLCTAIRRYKAIKE